MTQWQTVDRRDMPGALVYPVVHDPHGCDRPGCTAARDGRSPWCADHQPEARA